MKPAYKWLFAASLIANIFLAGFILGHTALHRHGMSFDKNELAQLAPEKREMVESMMNRMRERRKEDFGKIKQARQEIANIMEAPVFDEASFIAKSKATDAIFTSGKQQMIEEMARLAKGFNQKERHILAEQLRRPSPPPPMDKSPGGP